MLRDSQPTVISLDGQPAGDGQVTAVYRCKLQLADLAETDDPDIRFCDRCQQKVFKVIDFGGFERVVASKGCVWGPVDARPFAGGGVLQNYVGVPVIPYESSSALQWD